MTPTMIATLTILTAIVVYGLLCWVAPFGKHHRCRGTGVRRTLLLRRMTTCRGCKGSGRKRRWGRAAYAQLRQIAHDAARAKAARERQP
ncbi:hypothetical protein [Allorhizocola rhizosphaerae]|uniref:hypothetical protein n=1 Tax=Allorhizocola rhizosphaerae TaxID=1872709 RepID=UPI0013C30211|nr:hypothetical protein [Allorhizocola rhizosphaerae]